ncbi:MAG: hypothetical protein K6A43_09520 [Treponema sp.]|nr:hypothetical protein [Treponema sp.]
MKKIVGIIGAALLASSIFAVDFSAGVRLEGDLFNYSVSKKDGSKISALMEKHVNEFYHAPLAFAISGDRAGGKLQITDKGDDKALTGAWSIWFKPLDMVKITVGAHDLALNQEHNDWCNSETHLETTGYALNLNVAGFTTDIILNNGNGNAFFTANGTADPTVKEIAAVFGYGADFGTINAFFDAADTFKAFRFAAGYNAKGLPVNLFVNAIGYYAAEEFKAVRGEADVSTNFGSIGWELFLAGGYNLKSMKDVNGNWGGSESWHIGWCDTAEKAFLGFSTKFNIPVSGFGFYVYIKDSNVLADNFAIQIKPGFTKSIGACALELALQADISTDANDSNANKVTIGLPVNFKVSF